MGGREMELVTKGVEAARTEDYDKSREVRLGLVMYGGVSLAIYINGVAHEFFNSVRGMGVYRLIKALTDSDIVVDIISGTSAGGINGIFLAYSLCNRRNFADTAKLWRIAGNIRELLRDPGEKVDDATSLLKSREYYQPQLEKALSDMGSLARNTDDDPSPVKELDLFITGTDVHGNVYTDFDDAGHSIDIKDHRAVFLLQHREGRKAQFSDEDATQIRALAKLARITSCFPAAFEPVHVGFEAPEDKHLQTWGKLGKEAYFLDGGVLDNKPFTYPIKQIYYRTADRLVDRVLFYVEPDPEAFGTKECGGTDKPRAAPDMLTSVMTSVVGIPRYESIADDLRALAEHNARVEQHRRLVRSSREGPGTGPDYRQGPSWALYEQSRLVHLSNRVVQGLFKMDGRRRYFDDPDERALARRLIQAFDGGLLEGEKDVILRDLDVYFPIRRLFRVIYMIHEILRGGHPEPASDAGYRELLKVLNRQLLAYEIVRAGMEGLVDDLPAKLEELGKDPGEIWKLVKALLGRLLYDPAGPASFLPKVFSRSQDLPGPQEDWLSQNTLTLFHAAIKKQAEHIIETRDERHISSLPNPTSLVAMLGKLDASIIKSFLHDDRDPVRLAFENFECIDSIAFPMEVAAGLHEKDRIEVVRVSPVDARKGFSRCNFRDKISGDAVFHFGGFFKQSWRSNDILWGRLDGLCELVETLLGRNRLEQVLENDERRKKIRERFLNPLPTGGWKAKLDPKHIFPLAGSKTQEDIRAWIERLLSDNPDERLAALDEKQQFQDMLELLIEAAQLEVIRKDFPNVILDAKVEQDRWNTYSERPGTEDEYIDRTVSAHEAYKQVADEVECLDRLCPNPARPKETGLGSYFQNVPRTGAETLQEHIPRLVVLELLATMLLVIRNCVARVLENRGAGRVAKSPLFRFGLGLPLKLFYRMTRFSSHGGRWRLVLRTVLNTAAVLLLALGFLLEGAWSGQRLLIFLGLPVLIFAVQAFSPLESLFRSARAGKASTAKREQEGIAQG